jgi:quercetin dioxygenase-like cupin family protein
MTTSKFRLVVVGGPSGRDAVIDARAVAPAVETATAVVHEVCEITAAGAVADPTQPWHHDPTAGGAILRIVTLKPAESGDPAAQRRELHSSETVDVGIVLSGQVTLILPEGQESVLATDDSFVLLGVEHAWRNDSTEPCRLAVTLLKPPSLVDR